MGYQALLFCPDEKTARAVTQVLSELDFTVEPCTEPFAAVKKLMAQHFDAVVVDCDNEQNATLLFKSARNSTSNQSSLAVAVVEGQAGVAKAFRIGANLVLTRPINIEQAKGTLRVARGLLRKGGDPVKAATSAGPGMPSSPPSSVPAASRSPNPVSQARSTVARPGAKSPFPPAAAATSKPKTEVSPNTFPAEPPAPIAPKAPAASSSAFATPKKSYPWQPVKPGAEPMASALRKAAEAAGVADTPPVSSSAASTQKLPEPLVPAPTVAMHGAASAPAPAKERIPADLPLITPSIRRGASVPETAVERDQDRTGEEPISNVEPPSFSMGAPVYDEEESPSSKKALIIVAVVVLLAALAGYLGWKNMSGSSAVPNNATPPSPTSMTAPASAPAVDEKPSDASSSIAKTSPAHPEEAPPESAAAKPAPPEKPANREHEPVARIKESETSEPPAEQPAPQPIVVKNEESNRAAKKPQPEPEPVIAPSAIGVPATSDSKALAAISSAPVSVPKPTGDALRVSQGVSEGLILKRIPPRYPSQAIQMRKEGSVQLQATVTKEGMIKNLKVISGDAMLARAALDAVKQWKYKPYYLNGEPVDIQTEITVNFKLPH